MDFIRAKRKNQSKVVNPSKKVAADGNKPLSKNSIQSLSISYLKEDKSKPLSISNNAFENKKDKCLETSSSSLEYNGHKRTFSAPHLIVDNVASVNIKENRNNSFSPLKDINNNQEEEIDKNYTLGVESKLRNNYIDGDGQLLNEPGSESDGKPVRKKQIESSIIKNIEDNRSNEAINDILRRICETENKSEYESINLRENDNATYGKMFTSNSLIRKDTSLMKKTKNNNSKIQESFISNKEINGISKMYNLENVSEDYYSSFNPMTKTPHFLKEVHYVSNTNINPFSSTKNILGENLYPNDISKNIEEISLHMKNEEKEEIPEFSTHNLDKMKEDSSLTQHEYFTKNLKNYEDMDFTFKRPGVLANNNMNVSNMNLKAGSEIEGGFEGDFQSCEKINPTLMKNGEEINYFSKKSVDKSIEKMVNNIEGNNNYDNNSNLMQKNQSSRLNEEKFGNSNNFNRSVNFSVGLDHSLIDDKSVKDQKLPSINENHSNNYDNSSNLVQRKLDSHSVSQQNNEMDSNNLSGRYGKLVREESVTEEKNAFERNFQFNSIKGVNSNDNNSNYRVSHGNSGVADPNFGNSNNLGHNLQVSLNKSIPYTSNVESLPKVQYQDQSNLNLVKDNNSNLKITENEKGLYYSGDNVLSNNPNKENVNSFIGHSVLSQLSIEENSNKKISNEKEKSINIPDCKSNDNKINLGKDISQNQEGNDSNNIGERNRSVIIVLNEKEENDLINYKEKKQPSVLINQTVSSNNNISPMKIEVNSNINVSNDMILKGKSLNNDNSIHSDNKIYTKLPETNSVLQGKKTDNFSNNLNKVVNVSEAELHNNLSNNKNLLNQENLMSIDNQMDLSQMLNNLNISALMTNTNARDGMQVDENKSNIFYSKRENEASFIENSNNNQEGEIKVFPDNDYFSKNILTQVKKESDEILQNLSIDNHSNLGLANGPSKQHIGSVLSSHAEELPKKHKIPDEDRYVSNSALKHNNIKDIESPNDRLGIDHSSNNKVDQQGVNKKSRSSSENGSSNNHVMSGHSDNEENIPNESANLLENNLKEEFSQNSVEKVNLRVGNGFINRKSVKNNFQTDLVSQSIKTESLVDNEETLIKTDKINKKNDPLNNEVDNKRYFVNSSSIFKKEKKTHSGKNLINTENLINQEKLKNFIETHHKGKKNITITTDKLNISQIESIFKKFNPLSSLKNSENNISQNIEETLTVSQLNNNTLANQLILLPNSNNNNQCSCINKSFNTILNPPDISIRDLSNYPLNIQSSVQIQINLPQYIPTNKNQNNLNLRKISNEDSNKKENSVTAPRTNGSKMGISCEELKSVHNVSSLINNDAFNSFHREINIQVGKSYDHNLLVFQKTYEKPRRFSVYNLKLTEMTETIEKEFKIKKKSKSSKELTRKRLDLKLNEPFSTVMTNDSNVKRRESSHQSERSILDTSGEFQVVMIDKDDEDEEDEDILSDEMILQFKQQELKMKQMADDSLKKEVHLKQVINNLQSIISKPSDKS